MRAEAFFANTDNLALGKTRDTFCIFELFFDQLTDFVNASPDQMT